jgi:uncharacterized Zn finger protein
VRIDLSCAQCGSNHFVYPLELSDTSVISCKECGHVIGTVAEVQQMVIRQLTRSSPGQDGSSNPHNE